VTVVQERERDERKGERLRGGNLEREGEMGSMEREKL
jgi:hypothetical protein